MAIERAVISVYDKAGVVDFAKALARAKVEIVSTGGTAKLLRDAGLTVRDISDLTGWPEMLAGRVKTLHPKVHGGILYRRNSASDRETVKTHNILPVDLVVVNLYPFEATAARQGLTVEELIENIDIGGPAMVRSASKNFESVAVVTDPADYPALAAELDNRGDWSLATRLDLAQKAFAATARYDGKIAMELERLKADADGIVLGERPKFPSKLFLAYSRQTPLRYGENPHQSAALYTPLGEPLKGFAGAKQLQGKELSYNNLVDLNAAWALVQEFSGPTAVIVKHNNPCGVAERTTLVSAYREALACDPVSAFGGVMAFNRRLDADTAGEVAKLFAECVAAPGFDPGALDALANKKNLRLMDMGPDTAVDTGLQLKPILGGMLVQDADRHVLKESDLKVVSKRPPTREEIEDMLFGWKVAKHVKSNAIVFVHAGRTLGVGAGQMSRVDSVKLAVMKAQQPLVGSVVASDAFFPFPDGVEEAAKAGATAVIEPGGSVRDGDVIAAADRLGLAMVFTGGIRHFRH